MVKEIFNITRIAYFSILFSQYNLVNKLKLNLSNKLLNAISVAILTPFIFVLGLHFSIGEIIGRNKMVSFHSIIIGEILLIALIMMNLLFFVVKEKYLKIEIEFTSNKTKFGFAYIIYSLFLLWFFIASYFAVNK